MLQETIIEEKETSSQPPLKKIRRKIDENDSFNDCISNTDFLNSFSEAFKSGSSYLHESSQSSVQPHPFTLGALRNLFSSSLLKEVRDELLSYPLDSSLSTESFWTLRSNDLYHFYQSPDWKGILPSSQPSPIIKLKQAFQSNDFINTLSQIAGIEFLKGKMDLAAQIYPKGGYLLCHDDDIRLEEVKGKDENGVDKMNVVGRRLAFILYLVDEDWSNEDGGELELFGVDEKGQPHHSEFKFVPQWNTLGFFVVNPSSYHQVCEVKGDRLRVSITGWLYGTPSNNQTNHFLRPQDFPAKSMTPLFNTPTSIVRNDIDILALETWISEDYLRSVSMERMKQVFADESCIELCSFLREDVFSMLVEDLEKCKSQDESKCLTFHPAPGLGIQCQKFQYLYCDWNKGQNSTKSIHLQNFALFLKGEPFQKFIREISSLSLGSDEEAHIRRFEPGGYQLIHHHPDIYFEASEKRPHNWVSDKNISKLDLNLFFSSSFPEEEHCAFGPKCSGWTWYVDDESGETLLKIRPEKNKLSLVYRDVGTCSCVRYLGSATGVVDRIEAAIIWPVLE